MMPKAHHDSIRFQSTPPHGGRRPKPVGYPVYNMVSIHAPARGATDVVFPLRRWLYVSIHAPARGATGSEFPRVVV